VVANFAAYSLPPRHGTKTHPPQIKEQYIDFPSSYLKPEEITESNSASASAPESASTSASTSTSAAAEAAEAATAAPYNDSSARVVQIAHFGRRL